ncbi:hypothetical protein L7F22_068840 [Adiantum nelumboides]|nr:hypothetical protein [Adiantum nelumboides]
MGEVVCVTRRRRKGTRVPKKRLLLSRTLPILREKVKVKFPDTFEKAMAYAREKDRKLKFQAQLQGGMEPPPPAQPIARTVAGTSVTDQESSQQELLQQITNQLESLSINLVQGVRAPQSGNDRNRQEGQRQPREYVCYNCGEVGHGMYFCPHPRRYQGNGNHRRAPRQQVTPPRARPPNGQQNAPVAPPVQILRPPPPPPQTPAEIPPLPSGGEDRAVSVITPAELRKAEACMILSRPRLQAWHRGRFKRNFTANIAPSQLQEEEEYDPSEEIRNAKAELSSLVRTCRQSCHGKLLHFRALSDGLEFQAPFPSLLVHMYTNCSAFDDARACLARLPPTLQNVFTWNLLFKALALHGLCQEAFSLYEDMVVHDVLPNKVTYRSMLDACISNPIRSHVFWLHSIARDSGLDTDSSIGTALANLYGRIGSLRDAARVFDLIMEKDVVSWTSMMLLYVQHGHSEMAIDLFEQMQLESIVPDRVALICAVTACDKPLAVFKGRKIHSAIIENALEADVTAGTALVSMYGKCKSLKDARTTFHHMSQPNVVTWNALIGANFQGGMETKALHSFHRMLIEGALPNRETYISFFGACARSEELTEGMLAHTRLLGSGIDLDSTLGNVLINMYGKCSSIKHARKVFERMGSWDVVSWTAMINVYAQSGDCLDAFLLFANMHVKGVKPNEYTASFLLLAALLCQSRVDVCIGTFALRVLTQMRTLRMPCLTCMRGLEV